MSINKKKRFVRKKNLSESITLQITSMADIFTIILIFVLKISSTEISSVSPSGNVKLPAVTKSDTLTESLKLELSEKTVLLDDKQIIGLNDFNFERTELESDGTPRLLNQAFIREKNKHNIDAQAETGKILLLADQKAPYSTIKAILNSAANNGYMDLKLVVVNKE